MHRKIDITGKRFGKLTVISEAGRIRRECAWLCKCDCGKEIVIPSYKLRTGRTKSCGCNRHAGNNRVNLERKRYGRLVVKKHVKGRIWLCQCDCGREIEVSSALLVAGSKKSCGCLSIDASMSKLETMNNASHKYGTVAAIKSTKTRNKLGIKGISISKSKVSPYEAKLMFNGKIRLRKTFATLEEAILARKEAEEKWFNPVIKKWEQETPKQI